MKLLPLSFLFNSLLPVLYKFRGKKIILAGTEVGLQNQVCHIISNSFIFSIVSFRSALSNIVRTVTNRVTPVTTWSTLVMGASSSSVTLASTVAETGLAPALCTAMDKKKMSKGPNLIKLFTTVIYSCS